MAGTTKQVQELYIAYFGRAADVSGLQYWTQMLDAGSVTMEQVSQAFAGSAEYKETYSSASAPFVLASVYDQLFGRAADAAGIEYWDGLLKQGVLRIDDVVAAIAGGAQAGDLFAYNAKVSVAMAFTGALDTPLEASAYAGERAHDMVGAYIAKVKDAATLAAAIDRDALDALIDSLAGNAGPWIPPLSASPDEHIVLVGLPDMYAS